MNSVSRTPRRLAMDRAYSDATGATEGSIIAAIITVQATRNAGSVRPIVPGHGPSPMTKR